MKTFFIILGIIAFIAFAIWVWKTKWQGMIR